MRKSILMVGLLLISLCAMLFNLPKAYAYDAEVSMTVIKKETGEVLASSEPIYVYVDQWFYIYEDWIEPEFNTTTTDIIRITKVLVIGAGLITGTITANIFGTIITIAVAATSTTDYEISIPPSNGTGIVSINFTGKLVPAGVGGYTVPVDKLALLAPYIGLVSTILIATITTVIYIRRIKKREQNNGQHASTP